MSDYEQNTGAHDAEKAYDILTSVPDSEIPKSLRIQLRPSKEERIQGDLTGSVVLYAFDRIEPSEHEGCKKVVYRFEKASHK